MNQLQAAIKIARETRLAKLLFTAMNKGQGKEKLETIHAQFNEGLQPWQHIKSLPGLRMYMFFNRLTINGDPEMVLMDERAETFAHLITTNNEQKTRQEISAARRRRLAEILLEATTQGFRHLPVVDLFPLFKGVCAFNSLPNLHVFVSRLPLTVSSPGAGNGRVRNIELCAKALEFIHTHVEEEPSHAELNKESIKRIHREDFYCEEFAPVGDSIFTSSYHLEA